MTFLMTCRNFEKKFRRAPSDDCLQTCQYVCFDFMSVHVHFTTKYFDYSSYMYDAEPWFCFLPNLFICYVLLLQLLLRSKICRGRYSPIYQERHQSSEIRCTLRHRSWKHNFRKVIKSCQYNVLVPVSSSELPQMFILESFMQLFKGHP